MSRLSRRWQQTFDKTIRKLAEMVELVLRQVTERTGEAWRARGADTGMGERCADTCRGAGAGSGTWPSRA